MIRPETHPFGEDRVVHQEPGPRSGGCSSRSGSISQIGRRLDLDRKTVRNCLRQTAYRPDGDVIERARGLLTGPGVQVSCSVQILYEEDLQGMLFWTSFE